MFLSVVTSMQLATTLVVLRLQVWRGEHYSCTRAEYMSIKNQLQSEVLAPAPGTDTPRSWVDLPPEEKGKMLKDRLKKYCQMVRVQAVMMMYE